VSSTVDETAAAYIAAAFYSATMNVYMTVNGDRAGCSQRGFLLSVETHATPWL
jgi:hypothetical protein